MMKVKIAALLAIVFLVGCVDRHHSDYYEDPSVRVKSIITEDAQFGAPAKIIIELENIGYDTAYDVMGSVDVELGRRVIESKYFDIPIIRAGYSVVVEIELTSVYYHNKYDRYVLEFGWFDYYDNYYE